MCLLLALQNLAHAGFGVIGHRAGSGGAHGLSSLANRNFLGDNLSS
jgi:hypothetical protein